jgi:hypothetical protein
MIASNQSTTYNSSVGDDHVRRRSVGYQTGPPVNGLTEILDHWPTFHVEH